MGVNETLTPDQVTSGSQRKVWWLCQKDTDHEWEAVVYSRAKGNGCPMCSGRSLSVTNSLATLYPELAEYEMRLVAIESEIRSTSTSTSAPVEVEEVAALLSDLPSMWAEATADERGRLLAPIIEHVLVDVESKRLSSLVPMSGFRTLLDIGIQKTADCSAVILAPSVIPQARGVLELVETGENRTRHKPSLAVATSRCVRRSLRQSLAVNFQRPCTAHHEGLGPKSRIPHPARDRLKTCNALSRHRHGGGRARKVPGKSH